MLHKETAPLPLQYAVLWFFNLYTIGSPGAVTFTLYNRPYVPEIYVKEDKTTV